MDRELDGIQHVEERNDQSRHEQERVRLDQDALDLVQLGHTATHPLTLLGKAVRQRALDLELEEAGRLHLDAERQSRHGRVDRVHVRREEPKVVREDDGEVGLLVVVRLGAVAGNVDVLTVPKRRRPLSALEAW